MKKYWRIYRDSYSKLKDYPARTDTGNLSTIYKKIWRIFLYVFY